MVDVDHFKLYNDTYGHLAATMCFDKVANAIKQMLQALDRPCCALRRRGVCRRASGNPVCRSPAPWRQALRLGSGPAAASQCLDHCRPRDDQRRRGDACAADGGLASRVGRLSRQGALPVQAFGPEPRDDTRRSGLVGVRGLSATGIPRSLWGAPTAAQRKRCYRARFRLWLVP